jgi:hypothetical protein
MNVWLRMKTYFQTFLDDLLCHHLIQARLLRPSCTVARASALQPFHHLE